MRTESRDDLIRSLECLADHPDRFRNVVPLGHELTFVAGIGVGVRFALDIASDSLRERELRYMAAVARGWLIDRHPHEQMLERGLSSDEVLSELVRLEIEFIGLAS